MEINVSDLISHVGYTKSATNYFVEYGFLTMMQGKDLVDAVHTIQAILRKLPKEIQTNGMERKVLPEDMLKWMSEVGW